MEQRSRIQTREIKEEEKGEKNPGTHLISEANGTRCQKGRWKK